MHKHTVYRFKDAAILPFLFETPTILRLYRQTQVRTLAGSTVQNAQVTKKGQTAADVESTSFLKSKAATSKSKSKGSNTHTTITTAERRVFHDIFNQVAGQNPSKATSGSREKRDHFLDHEDILSIFSSAVSSHVKEQKAVAEIAAAEASEKQRKRALDRILAREEEVLQRYPKTLRKAARRATAATLSAEDPETGKDGSPRTVTNASPKGEAPGDTTPTAAVNRDDGKWRATPPELDGERKQVERAVREANSEGNANRTRTPFPAFPPSFGVADHDEVKDLRRDMRPSFSTPSEKADGEENTAELPDDRPGLVPPSTTAHPEPRFRKEGRPSLRTTEKRAEDVASFAKHYGTVRPSFVRRAEDAAVVQEKLQHDPESVFQGTIHRYCHEEMEEIADSFQRAFQRRGDVGIWNTCLAMVFPMIDLLDASLQKEKSLREQQLSQHRQSHELVQETPSRMPRVDASTTSNTSSPTASKPPLPDLPPYLPPLYIISRLYPAALLLAFRLLRTKAPTSPLALALLPQIRSLGPTSYVLGASTEFYNALIELRWDVYSDLQSMDGLLREMERSGVEFDMGTWNILVKVRDERFTDLQDVDGGMRGAGFWARPFNVRWFQKVAVEWKSTVAERLREHGLDTEITEREYGAGSTPELGAVDAEQRTVWL